MSKKYRARPREIHAVQWLDFNYDELTTLNQYMDESKNRLNSLRLNYKDWLVVNDEGMLFKYTDDIFKKTYEEVKESE